MHVGKGILLQNLDGSRRDSDVIAMELALAEQAEGLGFQSIWTPEHHFGGYHMAPNVLQILTYLAARTTTVRLGSMVIVLPWHQPARVAEDLAMLDTMSRGRVVLGLGRGLGRIEFEGFGVQMAESRDRFAEAAEIILGAFESGKLDYAGRHYDQSRVELRPAPWAPLRGRTYASAISPASMEMMARLGLGVMVIAQKPWAMTEVEVRGYAERYEELNGEPPPKPILVTFVTVADTEARAREMWEQYTLRYARSTLDWYEWGNSDFAKIPGYEYYAKLAENISRHGPDSFASFVADLQVWGTPDQVVEKLTENVRRLNGAGVIAALSFGGMDHATAEANQRLFAEAVLPRLRAIDPDRDLPPAPAEQNRTPADL